MESKVNCGQELGTNLVKICKKLLNNQNLCKLLINTDLDPLNAKLHPDLENTIELFGSNVRVIPLVEPSDEKTTSKIIVIYEDGQIYEGNLKSEYLKVAIYVYVPFSEWLITGDNLRPHAIMSEIRKSLSGKRINGLGEINYEGFTIATLTDQVGSYKMEFSISAFN